jgi:hypothetical protein
VPRRHLVLDRSLAPEAQRYRAGSPLKLEKITGTGLKYDKKPRAVELLQNIA